MPPVWIGVPGVDRGGLPLVSVKGVLRFFLPEFWKFSTPAGGAGDLVVPNALTPESAPNSDAEPKAVP